MLPGLAPVIPVRKERRPYNAGDEHVLTLNYATLAIVDEILWLPSAAAASTVLELLYGAEFQAPREFLERVGKEKVTPSSVARLVGDAEPLAIFLPARLGPASAWRSVAVDLGGARALARQRYRSLQTLLMTRGRPAAAGPDSLVRHTYGTRTRWGWNEAARRLLDRVVVLNRAALAVLITRRQSPTTVPPGHFPELPAHLPDRALASLAEALPPLVMPDFQRLVEFLAPAPTALADEESVARYRSLFAEMISLAAQEVEVRA